MKIVADEKILFLKELFSNIGILTTLPASEINRVNIKGYDTLLVRSVTRVNKELLENTNIKIVGSMTSGIDHIDRNYLRKNRIKLLYAPGSNANSVAEYVLACLLILAKKKGFSLHKKTIGIIGVGNVGKRVEKMCRALGMKVLLNDPPKFYRTKNKKFLSFKKLSDADIITLHVPLTFKGKYKTCRMVNENFLKQIKQNTILINTSRGGVIDESALMKYTDKLGGLILDVWNNEPVINRRLLKIVDIATPHIAGYSLEGKFNATFMIYKNLCRLSGKVPEARKNIILQRLNKEIIIGAEPHSIQDIIYDVVLEVYNPLSDSKAFKKMLKIESDKQVKFFESLRNNYPVRREFGNYYVRLNLKTASVCKGLGDILSNIGFKVLS